MVDYATEVFTDQNDKPLWVMNVVQMSLRTCVRRESDLFLEGLATAARTQTLARLVTE